ISSYQWDFGDGMTGTGITVSHSYSTVGTYSARLTVTDSSDQTDSRTLSIRVSGKSLGADNAASFFADPVNLATGNFILSVDDLTVAGLGFPLKFSRFYNSKDSSTTGLPLGRNWTHSYNLSLNEDVDGIITIRFGDGRKEIHAPKLSGGYTAETGVHDLLEKTSTDHFILLTKDQIAYTFVAGRIESISDRNNNSQVLAYDAQGRLQSVTDSSGRSLQLTYDPQSRISVLTDPLGRTVQYAYGPTGDLTTVTNPRNGTIHYAYDGLHQILTAIDPNGHVFVTNEYDSQQRVVSVQRDALGNKSDFHYDFVSGLTTVTDPFGNVTRHLHDDQLRLIAKTN
ncbi:MAG: PKD domain-containing protein, partial [Acidobacteria bacterium]|nr:PKD domain-containing protein [Acidobacteriota bacterium]